MKYELKICLINILIQSSERTGSSMLQSSP